MTQGNHPTFPIPGGWAYYPVWPSMRANGPVPVPQGQQGMVPPMPPQMPLGFHVAMPPPGKQGVAPPMPPPMSVWHPFMMPPHGQQGMAFPMPPQMPFPHDQQGMAPPMPPHMLVQHPFLIPPHAMPATAPLMPPQVPPHGQQGMAPPIIIDKSNAQEYLPKEARIFVGNLPRDMSIPQMEQVLGRIFSPIGFCYIYPQLDSLLPTAFVQYIYPECASRALQLDRQASVTQRYLRIEAAKGRKVLQNQSGQNTPMPQPSQQLAAVSTTPDMASSSGGEENEAEEVPTVSAHPPMTPPQTPDCESTKKTISEYVVETAQEKGWEQDLSLIQRVIAELEEEDRVKRESGE